MKAEINMYECVSDYAKKKYGQHHVWITQIGVYAPTVGPFHKVFKTEAGAHRHLVKLGFSTTDGINYEPKHRSEELMFIERHFEIADTMLKERSRSDE